MHEPPSARPIRAVVGEGIRRIRDTHHVRQEDIARAARKRGWPLAQTTVAALERGERAISVAGLCLLPFVLTEVCGHPITLADLADKDEAIQLRPGVTTTWGACLHVWSGGATSRELTITTPIGTGATAAEERIATRIDARPSEVAAAAQALWSHTFDQERDRIATEQDPNASPYRRSAIRGGITRTLTESLAKEIARQRETA